MIIRKRQCAEKAKLKLVAKKMQTRKRVTKKLAAKKTERKKVAALKKANLSNKIFLHYFFKEERHLKSFGCLSSLFY
jgi:hypothetical protein